MQRADPYDVGSLGDIGPFLVVSLEWIERHCVVPDRFDAGDPFVLGEWQAWYFANFYRVKPDADLLTNGRPVKAKGASAFVYRRAQVVMPQKVGKGPMTAAHVCVEGVGPSMFFGWAKGGEKYRCSSFGCGCGWVYTYEPGEPMAIPRPTALIQVTAYSQEQTDNVYKALRPMIDKGPLSQIIPKTGEELIRLPGGGEIATVTSSAQSRLGQRVTFVPQDETGIWTARNGMTEVAKHQRRGLSGMGGRAAETTNAWDPAEQSVAQQTAASALRVGDIFRLHRQAPPKAGGMPLSYGDKRERSRIHRYVYAGSPWVDLADIEAEASELLLTDPANAERFYGNRVVAGLGAWMDDGLWARQQRERLVPEGAEVAGGFDGSLNDDHTGIRLETRDGFRFTPRYGPDRRLAHWNPKEWNGKIPRGEVHAAVDEISRRYKLRRLYCDPKEWRSEIGGWAQLYGEDVVYEWATYRIQPMYDALERSITDLRTGASTVDLCPVTADHIANARKIAKPQDRYILGKPDAARKIDMSMADTLAHEAASDLRADGWPEEPSRRVIVFR